MRASKIVAMAVFPLALCSTAAWAEETAKPAKAAPPPKVIVLPPAAPIHGHAPRYLSVYVSPDGLKLARLEPRLPLVDRIGTAVEADPF